MQKSLFLLHVELCDCRRGDDGAVFGVYGSDSNTGRGKPGYHGTSKDLPDHRQPGRGFCYYIKLLFKYYPCRGAGKAMMGQLIGNLLNVVLDPIMILVFDWGIAGAAVATVIGNLFGAAYYILYFLRGKSVLSIHPKDFAVKDRICSGVLAIGIPASLGSLLMSVSQIVVNSQLVNYGDMAVAGMGVAMKVTIITGMLCIGMGQGVQPLLGYCVGAGVWDRFKRFFRFSVLFALAIGGIMTLLCYLFTGSMVKAFLENPEAYDYGVQFARILLSTSALFGVFYVLCNTLQAMGAATAALIVNLSRQGIIYIPAVFIMQVFFGITGLAWAQPVADLMSLLLVAVLYVYTIRRMESRANGARRRIMTFASTAAGWEQTGQSN